MPETTRRFAVILNAGSGGGAAESARDVLAPLFERAGIDAKITLAVSGEEVDRALADAISRDVDTVVAGGGDGTVNSVANAIHGRGIRLGVLPLGTLNHFARDLGIPLPIEEAAAVLVAGHTTRIDVGEVNGRLFLNNSSVGIYPRIVQLRERYKARGIEKWLVAAWATARVTRTARPLRLALTVDGQKVVRMSPLIFIGNNEYRMAGFDASSRDSLREGQLGLYVVRAEGQWQLLRLIWRILAGTAHESGALAMALASEADVELAGAGNPSKVVVAVDGEVVAMALPLRYQIRPQSLDVLVPPGADAGESGAVGTKG